MSTHPAPYGWQPASFPEGESRITSFFKSDSGVVKTDLSQQEIESVIKDGSGRLWVDVDSHYSNEWMEIAHAAAFHPLTIEDTLSPESRIKIEEYDNYLFVVARDASFATDTPDPYDFETSNAYLYIGANYLVTVHERRFRATETLRDRLTAGPELMDRGVDYLAYAVLDALIDLYFPMLDEIDGFVDQLEVGIFEQQASTAALEKIFALKRTLLALRRHHAPMREMLATLANRPTRYLAPATQVYFRDVYDHVVRQVESIETYRDLLSGALEIYFSVVSQRTNEIMKALTVVGTFLLPATWIASIYGMNFQWMPWLHSAYGFWIAMAIMVGTSVLLMAYIKHKRWM